MDRAFHPRRIVSLQPSASVVLCALGLADRIVACTRYCSDVCPQLRAEAATQPAIVADSWTARSAEILASQPDLVIAAVPYQLEAVAEILKAGVRFLGLAPRTLQDIYTDIAAIAGIVGAEDCGQRIIAEMQAAITSVQQACLAARSLASPQPLVYCEEWGKPLIASQPWVAELVAAAGGRFLGAWLLSRYDWTLVLALFSGLILLCFLGSVTLGVNAAVFLLPASGLFMSVIYPTINSKGISCFAKAKHGAVSGVLLFFTCTGAALGPLAMGAVSDAFGGPKYGFVLATVFAALLFGGLLVNWIKDPARAMLERLDRSEYSQAGG